MKMIDPRGKRGAQDKLVLKTHSGGAPFFPASSLRSLGLDGGGKGAADVTKPAVAGATFDFRGIYFRSFGEQERPKGPIGRRAALPAPQPGTQRTVASLAPSAKGRFRGTGRAVPIAAPQRQQGRGVPPLRFRAPRLGSKL